MRLRTIKQKLVRTPVAKLSAFAIIFGFMMSVGGVQIWTSQLASAQSAAQLRARSAALEAEIAANNAQAEALHAEATSLKNAIAELDVQINQISAQIELTNVKLAELDLQLQRAQAELERQKDLLRASMRALYVRGGASTVELLVASDSFSEFMDEQEYLDKLKGSIQDSANKIIELKQQIQTQQEEQKKLLEEQKIAKGVLDATRSQRSSLLAQTEGKEARYREIVAQKKAELAKAEAALAAALSSGSFRTAPVGPVAAGDVVGRVGNTGLSTAAHLHLEVRVDGRTTDPAPYIRHSPVDPVRVTQGYNAYNPLYASGRHSGIDYGPGGGKPIFAIDNGYLYRGCSNSMLGTSNNAYGYVAIVQHSGGHVSVYAHMSDGPAACNYNTYYN